MKEKVVNAFKKLGSVIAYKKGEFDGSLKGAFCYLSMGGVPEEKSPALADKTTWPKKRKNMTSYECGYEDGIAPFRVSTFRK